MSKPKCLLVGLSGPSSSGKTTIARLLRDILQNSFILHEDDFFKTDADIPFNNTHNIADWDCLEAIDLPALESALIHIKANGSPPPDLVSKEDKNEVGEVDIDANLVERLKQQVATSDLRHVQVAMVDGFLLYSDEMRAIRDAFDVKLFLQLDHDTAKTRREARGGYVTIEGWWQDPPGYVDNIVWPNYVNDHKYLFYGGNVEGEVNEEVAGKLNIDIMTKDKQGDVSACLQWAFGKLEGALRDFQR
ncbi:hypothetical protein Q7P37_004206 [Cladosporium fusiforme]